MSKKEFITILAITLIVIIVWVTSDLVHTRSNSKDLPDVQKYLEPLEPNFDKQTLDRISNLSTPAPAPSAGVISTPIASPSSSPNNRLSPRPTASATASASPKPSASSTPR